MSYDSANTPTFHAGLLFTSRHPTMFIVLGVTDVSNLLFGIFILMIVLVIRLNKSRAYLSMFKQCYYVQDK